MYLYHYYDKSIGSFKNISELNKDAAMAVLSDIKKKKPNAMCAKKQANYMDMRLYYEGGGTQRRVYEKGDRIERITPHYMVIEAHIWSDYTISKYLQ